MKKQVHSALEYIAFLFMAAQTLVPRRGVGAQGRDRCSAGRGGGARARCRAGARGRDRRGFSGGGRQGAAQARCGGFGPAGASSLGGARRPRSWSASLPNGSGRAGPVRTVDEPQTFGRSPGGNASGLWTEVLTLPVSTSAASGPLSQASSSWWQLRSSERQALSELGSRRKDPRLKALRSLRVAHAD